MVLYFWNGRKGIHRKNILCVLVVVFTESCGCLFDYGMWQPNSCVCDKLCYVVRLTTGDDRLHLRWYVLRNSYVCSVPCIRNDSEGSGRERVDSTSVSLRNEITCTKRNHKISCTLYPMCRIDSEGVWAESWSVVARVVRELQDAVVEARVTAVRFSGKTNFFFVCTLSCWGALS